MSLNRPSPILYKWGEKSLTDEINLSDDEKTVVVPPISGANYTKGHADFQSGFPKTTMIAPSQGGQPPWGKDHNGILYFITERLQWIQSGGTEVFNQSLCDQIGGYSWGAILSTQASPTILWFSLVSDNIFNPENETQVINGNTVKRSGYWQQFSLDDIENLKKTKANLNGSDSEDFYVQDLIAGGLGIGGTNGVGGENENGNKESLWSISPQLLSNSSGDNRSALLNLIYAGADEADKTAWNTRQIMQISADRTKNTSGDIKSSANQAIIQSRNVNLFSNLTVYGTANLKNGVQGVPGDTSENYKSDRTDYKPGQVMMRAINKGNEVELCTNPKRVFGVISTNPFITMNSKNEDDPDYDYYVCIALLGRVPVLVEGPLTIEDHITPTDHGTAIASQDPSDTWIGWPIEPDPREELRLVECFVRAVV